MVRKRRKVKPEKIVKRAMEAFEQGLISREFYEEILKKYGFEPEKPKPILEAEKESIEEPGQLRPPLEERVEKVKEVKPVVKPSKPRFKPAAPKISKPKLRPQIPHISMIAPIILAIIAVSGVYYLYRGGYIHGISLKHGKLGKQGNITGKELYSFDEFQRIVYHVELMSKVQNRTLNYTLTVDSTAVAGRACWLVWVNATSKGQFVAAYKAIIAKDNNEILVSSIKSAAGPLVNVTALTLLQQTGIGLWNETVNYAGEELITTPLGTFKCRVYNIVIGSTNMTFWVSDKYPAPVMWRSETPGIVRTAVIVSKE